MAHRDMDLHYRWWSMEHEVIKERTERQRNRGYSAFASASALLLLAMAGRDNVITYGYVAIDNTKKS